VAICIFRRGREILVVEGWDAIKGRNFYRPLGGEIQYGETSAGAVVRERSSGTSGPWAAPPEAARVSRSHLTPDEAATE